MTKSQIILAALTALITLNACSKTFHGARTAPTVERCTESPAPLPVAPVCGE